MTQTTRKIGDKYLSRVDLAAGGVEVLKTATSGNATLVVAPGATGTVAVEFSCSSPPAGDDWSGALWAPAEGLATGGIVSALLLDTVGGTVTAMRFTASGAGARIEVAQ